MAQRDIIRIDEDLCDGCGACITSCAEGALQLIDGKARLVREIFCDGFGDCIGGCPTGALTIERRDAADYDSEATRAHVERIGGAEAVARFDAAAAVHEPGPPIASGDSLNVLGTGSACSGPAPASGCPGSRAQFRPSESPAEPTSGTDGPRQAIPSELRQWPVQLHLVPPGGPAFRGRELVILNTCGAIASADVHWRFLRGRSVVVACPKLDDTSPYVNKLAAILADPSIPKATVVRMEVPCCGGLTMIADQARAASGRADLVMDEVTLGVNGDVRATQPR